MNGFKRLVLRIIGVELPRWRDAKIELPETGDLIVKRWKRNDAVWAGTYNGSDKDASFDEWVPLPQVYSNREP